MTSNSIAVRIGMAALVIAAGAACGSDPVSEPTPFVTSVTASIAPGQSGTSGPFDFTGTVTATGAMTVTYRWELSDGTLQDVQVMQFGAPGSLPTTYQYSPTPKFCLGADQVMWARLNVLGPNVIASANVSFTRKCLAIVPRT